MIPFTHKFILLLLAFICIPLAAEDTIHIGEDPSKTFEHRFKKADELLMSKTVANLESAIEELKPILKASPDNYEALVRTARAYIDILTVKTSALIIEKDEYKPLLKDIGSKADMYARKAYTIKPQSKEAIMTALQAHGYYSSSFGIAAAIFKGAAGRYKKLAYKLIDIDDFYKGAFGYRSLGKLYIVAPWPVGSKNKAEKFYKKALEKESTLLEPHYYLGLIYLKRKQYDLAKSEFQRVINNPPHNVEKHYIQAFKKESQKNIDLIKAKTLN